jgi:Ca2+-binding RTX toxin-like protein
MATSFNINQADLAFILKQIRIAEATSEGYTPVIPPVSILQAIMDAYGLDATKAAIAPFGLRTVDGTYNNLASQATSTLGAADTLFPRLLDPQYVNDSYATPGSNVVDPAPRVISNLIVDMTAGNPAAVMAALENSVFEGTILDSQVAAAATAIRTAHNLTTSTDIDLAAAKTFQESADFAVIAQAKALIAKTKVDELVTALALDGTVDPSDIVAVDAAIAAALAASKAADAVVARITFANGVNVTAQDIADAQAVATNAALLRTNLLTLKTALNADPNVDQVDTDDAVAAALLADANVTGSSTQATALNASSAAALPAVGSAQTAATNADNALGTLLTSYGIEFDPLGSLVIPNRSPDIGLSPGFNSWMTIFGQFFDHGLDLVTKGGGGTVFVPLAADDPLVAGADGVLGTADDLPANLRFMALTRATPTVVGGVMQHENTTTSFIDQNQTYTSHSSHQVFLREYKTVGGKTVSTGHLLDGTSATGSVAGSVGNWADVKAQALQYLGIKLTDFDVHNVPLLRTDQYGKFIPDPATGYAQVIVGAGTDGIHNTADDIVVSGTPANPVDLATVTVQRTNHAFLNDIAHHAASSFVDFNHNGTMDGPDYRQVADANIDRNGDGLYTFADLDVDGNLDVTDAEIASLVADVNHDSVVNLADVDRNNDGLLTDFDFDIDGNGIVNKADLVADDRNGNTYDNEMLDAHFITGDGRGNENIALTAVHSVFHSEHNRAVEVNKLTILQSGDLDFINEWLLTDLTVGDLPSIPTDPTALAVYASNLNWDGDRLFQAARFSTEMQYQHLVFEEFARRIQPNVDPFVFNNSPNIDPSITAEFAHTVYRFGHSMLTGTVDRLDNNLGLLNGDAEQQTLLAMFLNPQAYVGSGATLEEINANLIRGLSRDVGNAMDEFIVSDVRSNLLGLPLDLGALNIARGRDTGIPSLNQTRAQLYNDTGLADLKPYDSWVDFGRNIKNAASLVNFIAAYGTHSTITSQLTVAGKRAAAELIFFGGSGAPADRLDFLNATGLWTPDGTGPNDDTRGGLNLIDLWIGGLAEANPEFGGMLGTTFNYVFEAQMESLQNGDRLYYLSRTQGTNLLNQLEPNTFSDLVMRNTELGDEYATHLNGALFVTPDHFIELDRGIAQTDYSGSTTDGTNDPSSVTRNYTNSTIVDVNHDFGGTLRVTGGAHYVLGGTEGNDSIYGDKGIDTLWGDGGNDYLNGGTESDNVFGGEGDDIIEDPFGDDVLRGNQGNDVITSSRGLDLLFGDQGSDAIFLGQDASEVFGGSGDDFILGGVGGDALLGNEGNDWIEGGAGFDAITGENSDLFFNSPIIGHDVLFGHGDETDFDAESGDDIMASAGSTVVRYEGMFGFDWGIAKNDNTAVRYDLLPGAIAAIPGNVLRDRFDNVEAVSGWKNNDQLSGDERGHVIGATTIPLPAPTTPSNQFYSTAANGSVEFDNLLHDEGVNRITGFATWFGNARATLFGSNTADFRDGNILMGGDGNDLFQGRGGFDLIDGDAWLNVRIKIVIPTGPNAGTYSAESLTTDKTVAGPNAGKVFDVDGNGDPNFASPAFGGASLTALLLNRTINPGQLSIVREILTDNTNVSGSTMNVDTAVFRGNLAEYDIEGRVTDGANGIGIVTVAAADVNGDGFISITDRDTGTVGATIIGTNGLALTLLSRSTLTDETDLIKNIENLRFADQTIAISGPNQAATGTVNISGTLLAGQVLTASLSGAADLDGITLASGQPAGLTFEWQVLTTGANPVWYTLQTSSTYTVRLADVGHTVRAVAVFKDNAGVTERIHSATTLIPVTAPTDIRFTGVTPGPAGLPTANTLVGNLSTTDDDTNAGFVYALEAGSSPNFTVSPTGAVTRINAAIAANTTYTLVISSTDITGGKRTETFTIRTGTNAGDAIAVLAANTTDHIIYGVGANDTLTGNVGDDNILGQAGDDRINGGAGQDIMDGGIGNDTFVVDNIGDVVIENAGGGTDTVESSITYTLGANLENLTLTGTAAINGTGNTQNNILRGNIGNNILDGSLGNDTMAGGAGDDTYIVDSPTDIVTEALGEGTDTIQSSVTIAALAANVENLTLTGASAINGTGNALNNVLTGNSANNTLSGGLGADAMFGGLGNDTYTVDNVGDTVIEGFNEGTTDIVNSSVSFTLGANVENLTLTGTAAINGTGNGDANALTGNSGANILDGGAGTDTMTGGGGNDTYFVDNIGDSVIDTAGTDTVNASITYTLGTTIENLTLTGTSAINGTGNTLANLLFGNGFNNVLDAGAGNDTIDGGGDNDTLIGSTGGDRLTGGTGADTFRFAVGDSLLGTNRDSITDLVVGTDIIDGPINFTFNASAVKGSAASLTAANINALLTAGGTFGVGQAATFTFGVGVGAQTFLAMNTGGIGFQASDTLIEITGYSGSLSSLVIV